MSRGWGVLVFDNISSYSLAEDNGAGNSVDNRTRHVEVEVTPVGWPKDVVRWVSAGSSVFRVAARVDGDNATLVGEGMHRTVIPSANTGVQ